MDDETHNCDGCGTDYCTEALMMACFESHNCAYCGGPVSYHRSSTLTAALGKLWCGCPESA